MIPGAFSELDPDVIRIATTPAYFRAMSICQPKAPIIPGDARQTIAREPDASFDYLLVDAFSSDAIPVHLLTEEALRLYLTKIDTAWTCSRSTFPIRT